MQRLTTAAIVIGSVDYGEADRIVTLLTEAQGKLSALARSARRSHKRYGSGLCLFGVGEAALCKRANSDLLMLEGFHGERGFPHLLSDVGKMAYGSYGCELVRELAPPRQPEPELFDLLLELLDRLDRLPPRPELLRLFEARLLAVVGLQPELGRCVGCRDGVLDDAEQQFDLRRGGAVCGHCEGRGLPLAASTRQALNYAQQNSLVAVDDWQLPTALNAACREIALSFIQHHLGRPLKSVEFMIKMNQAAS